MNVLLAHEVIQSRIQTLAQEIQNQHKSQEIILISILKSAFIFIADLSRELNIPHQIDFMQVASYGDHKQSSGEVKLLKDITISIEGRNVIVIEDIVDSGVTLDFILKHLQKKNPKEIQVCTLFYKPEAVKINHKLDYVGFGIPNQFVVGYGMDYQERYRNLKDICILDS